MSAELDTLETDYPNGFYPLGPTPDGDRRFFYNILEEVLITWGLDEPFGTPTNTTTFDKSTQDKHNNADLIYLDITTGYFNIEGWAILKPLITNPRLKIRLLLGTDYEDPYSSNSIENVEKKIFRIKTQETNTAVEQYKPEHLDNVAEFLSWATSKNVEIRIYSEAFLHAKTWCVYKHSLDEKGETNFYPGTLLLGSANFTRAGLSTNVEGIIKLDSGPGSPDGEEILRNREWFEKLWTNSRTHRSVPHSANLVKTYQLLLKNQDPDLIYVRILEDLLSEKQLEERIENLNEEHDKLWLDELYDFQRTGAIEATARLQEYHGCIISDEVGLGKTFTSGAVIKRYASNKEKVLVIVPPSLSKTWESYKSEHISKDLQGYITLKTYQKLTNQLQDLTKPTSQTISECFQGYGLIVIDEGHNYRNDQTARYRRLAYDLLANQNPYTDILLITATPIQNELKDLHSLLTLFLSENSLQKTLGGHTVSDLFNPRDKKAPPPGVLTWIHLALHKVMIRRTKAYVSNLEQNGAGFSFPAITTHKEPYEWSQVQTELATSLKEPTDGEPHFNYAFAQWSSYVINPPKLRTPIGFLYTTFFNTINSSPAAALAHIKNIKESTAARKQDIERSGKLDIRVTSETLIRADDEEPYSEDKDAPTSENGGEEKMYELSYQADEAPLSYKFKSIEDKDRYLTLLAQDLEYLQYWEEQLKGSRTDTTPQVNTLFSILNHIAVSTDNVDAQKVIVFTRYRKTAEVLHKAFLDKRNQGRFPETYTEPKYIHGGIRKDEKEEILNRFAPETYNPQRRHNQNWKPVNLIIVTDMLAEGVNLQQAANIIHWDLPYNPMVIAQRNGRVHRLNSKHEEVHSYIMYGKGEGYEKSIRTLKILTAKMSVITEVMREKSVIEEGSNNSHEELRYVLERYCEIADFSVKAAPTDFRSLLTDHGIRGEDTIQNIWARIRKQQNETLREELDVEQIVQEVEESNNLSSTKDFTEALRQYEKNHPDRYTSAGKLKAYSGCSITGTSPGWLFFCHTTSGRYETIWVPDSDPEQPLYGLDALEASPVTVETLKSPSSLSAKKASADVHLFNQRELPYVFSATTLRIKRLKRVTQLTSIFNTLKDTQYHLALKTTEVELYNKVTAKLAHPNHELRIRDANYLEQTAARIKRELFKIDNSARNDSSQSYRRVVNEFNKLMEWCYNQRFYKILSPTKDTFTLLWWVKVSNETPASTTTH